MDLAKDVDDFRAEMVEVKLDIKELKSGLANVKADLEELKLGIGLGFIIDNL